MLYKFLFDASITQVAIVLFLLKPISELRYIFIPDLGPKFCLTIANQYRLRACSELKAEAVIK